MAILSEIVACKIGYDAASRLIRKGKVKVNGITCVADMPLKYYDVVEFAGKRLCFVRYDCLIEENQ